jgi:hypothetical protein
MHDVHAAIQVRIPQSDDVGLLICMFTHADTASQVLSGDMHIQSSLGLITSAFNSGTVCSCVQIMCVCLCLCVVVVVVVA